MNQAIKFARQLFPAENPDHLIAELGQSHQSGKQWQPHKASTHFKQTGLFDDGARHPPKKPAFGFYGSGNKGGKGFLDQGYMKTHNVNSAPKEVYTGAQMANFRRPFAKVERRLFTTGKPSVNFQFNSELNVLQEEPNDVEESPVHFLAQSAILPLKDILEQNPNYFRDLFARRTEQIYFEHVPAHGPALHLFPTQKDLPDKNDKEEGLKNIFLNAIANKQKSQGSHVFNDNLSSIFAQKAANGLRLANTKNVSIEDMGLAFDEKAKCAQANKRRVSQQAPHNPLKNISFNNLDKFS